MSEKAAAFFSRLKQNVKITYKKTQQDDQEDLDNTEEEVAQGETEADGEVRSEKNVVVEQIASEKGETQEDLTSDDLTKDR